MIQRAGVMFLFSAALLYAVSFKLIGYTPPSIDTEFLSRQYDRLAETIGYDHENDSFPLVVLFYQTSEERKRGIRIPEWGGGGAIGNDSIVIPVDRRSAFFPSNLERVLIHEMVHIVITRAYGYLRVPRWFHEGVAMALSGDISFEQHLQISRAIVLKQLVTLDSMELLNRFDRWRAGVSYSQCHFTLNFLISLYGLELLPELLAETRKSGDFNSACVQVIGLSTVELQEILNKKLNTHYRLIYILGDYYLIWSNIIVLACIAFIVTMVRKKRRLKKMELEERYEEPDEDER